MKTSMFDVVDSTFFLNKGNVDVCRIESRINDEFLYFPKDCYRYRGDQPGDNQKKGSVCKIVFGVRNWNRSCFFCRDTCLIISI